MSDTGNAGSAVTPGWYTDPHDPRQLRWWSGEAWTEHVSPGSGQQQAQATQSAAQEQVAQAPAAQEPAVPEYIAPQQAVPQQEAQLPAVAQPEFGQPAAQDPSAPLPSRRALRDPATEASEAAEAALAAQAQQPLAQPQQAAQVEPVQPTLVQPDLVQPDLVQPQLVEPQAPVTAQPASAPIPTLPVAPTSFLEQQGYTPLDGAPSEQIGWGQPAAAQPVQPFQPAEQVQPAEAIQPVQPVQPVQPLQPLQPVEPQQPATPGLTLPPTDTVANTWNQPAAPTTWNQPAAAAPQTQQGWNAPATPQQGIDSLFTGAAAAGEPDAQANQWGLAPTDAGATTRTGAASDAVAGSGSVWAWLIAISPILAAGAIMYVLLTTKSALTDWPFEAAVAAPYVLVLLFALADRSALLNLGHTSPRSPAWALLSAPVYLIVRAGETRREDGSGTLFTIVWFISFLIAIGGIVGYGFLTHHALIAGLPT